MPINSNLRAGPLERVREKFLIYKTNPLLKLKGCIPKNKGNRQWMKKLKKGISLII